MAFITKAVAMARLFSLQAVAENACPRVDYDRAAATYAAHAQLLAQAGEEFLDQIPIKSGDRVVDAPAGPGTHTARLAKLVGNGGSVIGIDISQGMIAEACCKCSSLANVQLQCGELTAALRQQRSQSMDGILCSFGLVYLNHRSFLHETCRVLRSGGWLAVIENTKDTLADVNAVFLETVMDMPFAVAKRVSLHMPGSSGHLASQMARYSFKIVAAYDGQFELPCCDGNALMEYLTKAGVAAGYLDALAPAYRDQFLSRFVAKWDAVEARPVRHKYCAAIGIKQAKCQPFARLRRLLHGLGGIKP